MPCYTTLPCPSPQIQPRHKPASLARGPFDKQFSTTGKCFQERDLMYASAILHCGISAAEYCVGGPTHAQQTDGSAGDVVRRRPHMAADPPACRWIRETRRRPDARPRTALPGKLSLAQRTAPSLPYMGSSGQTRQVGPPGDTCTDRAASMSNQGRLQTPPGAPQCPALSLFAGVTGADERSTIQKVASSLREVRTVATVQTPSLEMRR